MSTLAPSRIRDSAVGFREAHINPYVDFIEIVEQVPAMLPLHTRTISNANVTACIVGQASRTIASRVLSPVPVEEVWPASCASCYGESDIGRWRHALRSWGCDIWWMVMWLMRS